MLNVMQSDLRLCMSAQCSNTINVNCISNVVFYYSQGKEQEITIYRNAVEFLVYLSRKTVSSSGISLRLLSLSVL
jgi:hypothetical protein